MSNTQNEGRSAQGRRPASGEISMQAALQHYQAGRLADAERVCNEILRARPEHSDALNLLGMTVYQDGRTQEGLDSIAVAIRANPGVITYPTNLGYALLGLGRFDEAAQAYRRALGIDPRNETALGNLGFALQQQEKLDEALAVYRQLAEIYPGHVGAMVSIGSVYREQGNLAQAEDILRQALEQQPNYPAAMSNLAGVLQEQGKLDEAMALYERTLELYPDFADALTNYAHVLTELGRTEEARARFHQAVEADPGNTDAHYGLGVLLKGQGDLEGAIPCLEAAVALDPRYLRAYWALQECYLLKDMPQRTLDYCDACVREFPDNQMTIVNRAIANLSLGRVDDFDYLYDLRFFPHAVPIEPPPAYASVAAFNDALEADILAHDSLRWQHDDYDTSERAFAYGILETPTPAITAFEKGLRTAIDAFIAGLEIDPDHPFFGNIPKAYDFKMWATVLQSGGWHRAHNHEDAWLSGVYYARAPVPQGDGGDRSGWIKFDGFTKYGGNSAYRDRVREVRPEEGLLLFFPSYFLHATNPFAADQYRISIAFDLQPRG